MKHLHEPKSETNCPAPTLKFVSVAPFICSAAPDHQLAVSMTGNIQCEGVTLTIDLDFVLKLCRLATLPAIDPFVQLCSGPHDHLNMCSTRLTGKVLGMQHPQHCKSHASAPARRCEFTMNTDACTWLVIQPTYACDVWYAYVTGLRRLGMKRTAYLLFNGT